MDNKMLADKTAREQVLDINQSSLVIAPAGSGKTSLLILWALKCLSCAQKPEEVYAITFTKKAVHEIKTRIMEALNKAAAGVTADNPHEQQMQTLALAVLAQDKKHHWDLMKNPSRLRVMTFAGLDAQLAAQSPILSGFGGTLRVEARAGLLYRQAIQQLFDEYESSDAEEAHVLAMTSLLRFADNRLETIEPLLSALLSTRDQWLGELHSQNSFDVENVLLGLISDRLNKAQDLLPKAIKTTLINILIDSNDPQHAEFTSRYQWPTAEPEAITHWCKLVDILLTSSGGLRKRITAKEGFPPKEGRTKNMKKLLGQLNELDNSEQIANGLNEIRCLPDFVYPENLNDFRQSLSTILYRLTAHLTLVFKEHGAVDFIEVALRAHSALGDDENINDAMLKFDYSIQHILVDEHQDTSLTQYALLSRLTAGWVPGDGRSICFCGDPKQSIYSFRQAEVSLFQNLQREGCFNNIPLQVLTLSTNFRSQKGIVEWFNHAFDAIFPSTEDPYTSAVPFSPSTAFKPALASQAVHINSYHDDEEEAAGIVAAIHTSKQQNPDASIAILVRNRSHVTAIIPALREAGIDYACQDIDLLVDKPAVSDLLCLIKALWHPLERTSWVGLIHGTLVGLSWKDCLTLTNGHLGMSVLERIRDVLKENLLEPDGRNRLQRFIDNYDQVMSLECNIHSLPQRAQALWYALGGPACVTEIEAGDIKSVFKLLQCHCSAGVLQDIEAFTEGLNGLYASPDIGTVKIMTVHGAKGLEYDIAFIPGMHRASRNEDRGLLIHRQLSDGYLFAPHPGKHVEKNAPEYRLYEYMHQLNRSAKQHEALRLLYVAVTRAKERLYLSGKKGNPVAGSFLSYLWPVVSDEFISTSATPKKVAGLLSLQVPLAPRLPLVWQWPTFPPQYTPKIDSDILPSEIIISGENNYHDFSHENSVERIIGIMYHKLMSSIHAEGIEQWNDCRIMAQSNAIQAACRRQGMPEQQVQKAVKWIIALVSRTVNSTIGQYLLEDRAISESELALQAYINNKWQSRIIDLFFVVNRQAWIIDYKSGGSDIAIEKSPAFIKTEVERHRKTLLDYCDLIQGRYQSEYDDINTALYFPAFDELILVNDLCDSDERLVAMG